MDHAKGVEGGKVGDLRFGQDHVAFVVAERFPKVFVILDAIGAYSVTCVAKHVGDGLGNVGRVVQNQEMECFVYSHDNPVVRLIVS
jgi:hypothetical protein